jgi:myxalamid-type polyketide synthase MxaD
MNDPDQRLESLSPDRQALVAPRSLESKLTAADRSKNEPIAIIGMGCRFPGGANDPQSLWRLLCDGVDTITEIPENRWDVEPLYDLDPRAAGCMTTRWGGFVENVDLFDAAFFNISPREAVHLDPQQRILLELAWEALEEAGQPIDKIGGGETGVFVGLSNNDYFHLQIDAPIKEAYIETGNRISFAAGRLCYALDLRGPSMVIDTVCSSSLVAVHVACQSLRTGECSLAIAGGVNLILWPLVTVMASKLGMMASDGRCKTFDARADGFVRSEGGGLVVLQRLSDAIASDAPILAVIRGSAVNQDGRSAGLTAPNGVAQRSVVRRALDMAGIDPGSVGYIETHGSGTALGDPIEVEALAEVYGRAGPGAAPCALGAVKSNIGHTEAAAGIAGLIKTVLVLRNQEIPPNLHFATLNPEIALEGTRFTIPTQLHAWTAGKTRRTAAVSAFGLSGTNAHVVLEEAPPPLAVPAARLRGAGVLPLSARSEAGLSELARRWQAMLDSGEAATVADLCYTAGVRRSHHAHRLAVVCETSSELSAGLGAFLRGEAVAGVSWGASAATRRPVFVFSGQGGQWPGMGRQLLARSTAFGEAIAACGAAFRAHVDWDLEEALQSDWSGATIDRIQPLLFAMGVGLSAHWRSWGVEPSAVVGHSMGEVTAAHVAGALSLADAARIICLRSRLLRRLSGAGAMVTVELSADAAAAALEGQDDQVSVAVSNSARSTVLSGERAALTAVVEGLERRGVFCRWVQVDVAAHSPQVEVLRSELLALLQGVSGLALRVPMWSTVLGRLVEGDELDAGYWVRNLREPVRFAQALEELSRSGHRLWLEISPHPVLLAALREGMPEDVAVASLRREEDEERTLLAGLGSLYAAGCAVDWEKVYGQRGRCVPLPKMPWQRERYWLAEAGSRGRRQAADGLGARVSPASEAGTHYWERAMSVAEEAELSEHRIHGEAVLAGSRYVELALTAAREVWGAGAYAVEALEWLRLLGVEDARRVQVALRGDRIAVYSQGAAEEGWEEHGRGRVVRLPDEARVSAEAVAVVRRRCGERVSGETFYRELAGQGLEYGRSYRGVVELWRGAGEAIARVQRRGGLAALLDSCFQVLSAALDAGSALVPVRAACVAIASDPRGEVWAWARRDGDIDVVDDEGKIVITVRKLELQALPSRSQTVQNLFYKIEWRPEERPMPSRHSGATWLIVADRGGLASILEKQLVARGDQGIIVPPQAIESHFRGGFSCHGIVYLAALDRTTAVEHASVCDGVLSLLKALAQAGLREQPRLWIVTRGVHAVDVDRLASGVAQSPLWGLGRVIAHEFPRLACTSIDLVGGSLEDEAIALAEEIRSNSAEDQLLLSPKGRLVARLVAADIPLGRKAIEPEGMYLITGGLGGLGLSLAGWLVRQGARRLALVSRNRPSEAARQEIAKFESAGAQVSLFRADTSQREQVEMVLRRMGERGVPLRGVFHSAAVLDDGILLQLTPPRFAKVMASKSVGAWNLHLATADQPLDWFVMFSSAASLLGSPGQGNYAAANAFLDALAHYRHSRGQPALSVNWGPWSEVGFASAEGYLQRLSSQGLESIAPETGLTALGLLLAQDQPQMAVLRLNVRRWQQFHPKTAATPFFKYLVKGEATDCLGPRSFRRQLLIVAPELRIAALEKHILDLVASILCRPADRLDRNSALGVQGLDSLMALELRNRLEDSLEARFPVTLIWNFGTIAKLALHLSQSLQPASARETKDSKLPAPLESVIENLIQLSTDDLNLLQK